MLNYNIKYSNLLTMNFTRIRNRVVRNKYNKEGDKYLIDSIYDNR